MNTEKLITLGALGIGLYLLYEWIVSQCETPSSAFFGSSTCQMLLGSAPVIPGVAAPMIATPALSSTPVSTAAITPQIPNSGVTTPSQATLINLLNQAVSLAGEDPANLSADQWAYYYALLPGRAAPSAATFEDVILSLGLTDATRGTPVTAQAFASAMGANGLSGLGQAQFLASWVPASSIHGGLLR